MKKIMFSLLLVAFWAVTASATLDNFYITLDGTNQIVEAGGSGYNGGAWYEYPQPDPDPSWWNEWFYDDPPDPDRWKKITWDIDISTMTGYTGVVEVAINWSILEYPETGPAGPPPMDDFGLVRQTIIETMDITFTPTNYTGEITIPDYNPEWVSIDVRAISLIPDQQVTVEGTIEHVCIPEPATLLLLGLGVPILSGLRRRKR